MSTKKTKKARKLRQQNLPGMEPPKIKAIDNATEAYVEIRDSRMALTKTEVAKRDTVLRLMKEHDLTSYEYDGKVVSIVNGEPKVKVKTKKDETIEIEDDE